MLVFAHFFFQFIQKNKYMGQDVSGICLKQFEPITRATMQLLHPSHDSSKKQFPPLLCHLCAPRFSQMRSFSPLFISSERVSSCSSSLFLRWILVLRLVLTSFLHLLFCSCFLLIHVAVCLKSRRNCWISSLLSVHL